MDIFGPLHSPKTFSRPSQRTSQESPRAEFVKYSRSDRVDLSDSEIRDKIEERRAKKAQKEIQAQPPKGQNQEESQTKEHLLESDVGANDPNDTNTTEKLKDLIRTGGFRFSGKEKSVLAQILKDKE